MKMTSEFKNAPLYKCGDGEQITCTDFAEALQDAVDSAYLDGGSNAEELYESIGPITVDAFELAKVSAEWIESRVDSMMEGFREDFNETYGFDDIEAEPWTGANSDWIRKVLIANITKSLRGCKTSICEQVGTHTFEIDEYRELIG